MQFSNAISGYELILRKSRSQILAKQYVDYRMLTVYYYQPKQKSEDGLIIQELSALADLHKTWGFWLMFHRLRKLNYSWNHKRVYRVYTMMRLNLRNKRKKRLPVSVKEPLLRPISPNITWSIDFMHDTAYSGDIVPVIPEHTVPLFHEVY